MSETKGQLIYLDNAATSYPKPDDVYEKVYDFIRRNAGSPSRGLGTGSTETNRLLHETRCRLAAFLGVSMPDRLIFTYSATDGLSTILFGHLQPGDHVLITPLEHNSVLRPLDALTRERDITFEVLPHDSFGRVDPLAIKSMARPSTRLICCNMVSNVIGTVAPYRAVCEAAAELGIPVLLDGSQAAGHFNIDLEELGASFFACPGHKSMFGIQGTGIMYVGAENPVRPLRMGGTGYLSESIRHPEAMPQYYEAGTVNMPGVKSLSAGLDYLESRGLDNILGHIEALTQTLLDGLGECPGVTTYGLRDVRYGHGGSVSFNVGDSLPAAVGEILASKYLISNRVGYHCAPLAHDMLGTINRGGTVRLSIGCFNTIEEINTAVAAVAEIARSL